MPDSTVGPARGWSREKRGFEEEFAAEVDAEIEALVGPGASDGLDFDAIEQAARRQALCAETHEGWLEDHRYLNMDFLKEQKKDLLQAAA